MTWQTGATQRATLASGLAYNLFWRRLTPDLCCAVPEDRPVPIFLEGSTWEYAGTLHQNDLPPPGFDLTAAELGVQLNGFHLFQIIRHIVVRAPVSPGPSNAPAQALACWLRRRIDQSHRRFGLSEVHTVPSSDPNPEELAEQLHPDGEPRTVYPH